MIVIDIGCATHGDDASIPYLIEEFSPEVLYGFDPAETPGVEMVGKTQVIRSQLVAWTHTGYVRFEVDGLTGHVTEDGRNLPCFDLASFIINLPPGVVLKMDAETSEYVLLPHLIERDADLCLKLVWVEFHCIVCGQGGGHQGGCKDPEMDRFRAEITPRLRCELHEWNR